MSELDLAEVEAFLTYVNGTLDQLPVPAWDDLVREAGGPAGIAVLCVDLTNAFTRMGNLASPRVAALIEPIVNVFRGAYDHGVRKFILSQDCHPLDSPEFEQYGPHAMCGSEEPVTVRELLELPFPDLYVVMTKTSLDLALDTDLPGWLDKEDPRVVIVVGDCTDLCVYQGAMYLKARSNAGRKNTSVIVPRNCVDTYDVSVEAGRKLGAVPHPAEFLHRLFLYHMLLNGIRVVRQIA